MSKKFSQRVGIISEPSSLQIDSMNDDLRNSLWNIFLDFFEHHKFEYWIYCVKFLAKHFFKFPTDDLPYRDYECKNWLKSKFYTLEWFEVYDLVDFIATNFKFTKNYPNPSEQQEFIDSCNYIFERELFGYRFISGVLCPITDKEEIKAITEATEKTSISQLNGAKQHLKSALMLLGQKPDPDYRNSIKESISAVESISKQISGTTSSGIADALDALSKSSEIHGALKSAFIKLYGYTSDEDGIRHAILDEPNVGFDEAKFMIVSCSAFINFLISKADNAGLIK